MITQIDVFLKNKPGELMKVAEWLARKKIQVIAHTLATLGDFGILKLIVENPEYTLKYLQKKNVMAHLTEAFCIRVKDQPGQLYKIAALLGNANINIKFIYGFSKGNNNALLVIEVEPEQIEHTRELLKNNEYQMVTHKDLTSL